MKGRLRSKSRSTCIQKLGDDHLFCFVSFCFDFKKIIIIAFVKCWMLIWNLAPTSPYFYWAVAGRRGHSLWPVKKYLRGGMIRSHLIWGHNEQSVRSGRKKASGRKQRGSSCFDTLVHCQAEFSFDLQWSGHLRSAWELSQWENQPEICFKEGMLLAAHCGFTIHEAGLYSSRTKKALYNIVIFKLCSCLPFPYQQQLQKWLSEIGEEGRQKEGNQNIGTEDIPLPWCTKPQIQSDVIGVQVLWLCVFLPDTEELRMDMKWNWKWSRGSQRLLTLIS